jgi:hypothetical protein
MSSSIPRAIVYILYTKALFQVLYHPLNTHIGSKTPTNNTRYNDILSIPRDIL